MLYGNIWMLNSPLVALEKPQWNPLTTGEKAHRQSDWNQNGVVHGQSILQKTYCSEKTLTLMFVMTAPCINIVNTMHPLNIKIRPDSNE